jgi:hypothetical protein
LELAAGAAAAVVCLAEDTAAEAPQTVKAAVVDVAADPTVEPTVEVIAEAHVADEAAVVEEDIVADRVKVLRLQQEASHKHNDFNPMPASTLIPILAVLTRYSASYTTECVAGATASCSTS